MKKILCLLLLISLLLVGCDEIDKQPNDSSSPYGTESQTSLSEGESSLSGGETSVPKVVIYTKSDITPWEYSKCTVFVSGVDEYFVDENAQIRVRGNSTSSGAKKPYNIRFSQKTSVLGMGDDRKWCLLANCYDKTLIRNQMAFDFANTIGVPYTPDYRVVDVYVNDRLYGTYLLTEDVEAASSRVNIDIENNDFLFERDPYDEEGVRYFTTPVYGIRFSFTDPSELPDDKYERYTSFIANAERALASGDFNNIKKYFDIKSMVKFYIALEYFKNVDVGTSSTCFFVKDGVIYGGPAWDFDLTAGNCSHIYYPEYNNIDTSGNSWEGLWGQQLWFKPLFKYPEFRNAVRERYLEIQPEIVNLYSDNELGKNYIDTALEKYGASFDRNYDEAGWDVSYMYNEYERYPDATFEENMNFLRDWLKNRNEWLLQKWS